MRVEKMISFTRRGNSNVLVRGPTTQVSTVLKVKKVGEKSRFTAQKRLAYHSNTSLYHTKLPFHAETASERNITAAEFRLIGLCRGLEIIYGAERGF